MNGRKLIPLLVIAAGLLAYHNSFTGPFIFDDVVSIQDNPTIRTLWPIWKPLSPPRRGGLTVEGRPLINLSLAVNYAIGRYNVWGYHALNLSIHLLAGLTLFGVMRRTLLQPVLQNRFGAAANELALATAVLWTVHPLQTESVNYVIQRAESLMGLFYLLTLYCFIRGVESQLESTGTRNALRPRLWYGLSVAACAMGMASKEVMVSAPLMVLFYDRTFVSGSFREAWRRHRSLYPALAGTWILLGFLAASSGSFGFTSENAQSANVTRWQYLMTEPGVILHYLRLTVWPHPLCFDYHGWPMATTWTNSLPSMIIVVILLGAGAWAGKSNVASGFLAAWFFLILAPSSSFIPLDSPAFEHRMYLSLAAVVALVVAGFYSLVGRRSVVAFAAVAIGFGILTANRNEDYRSELAIWQDTVDKRPDNSRAHNALGLALLQADKVPEALNQLEQALRIEPDYAEAHCNMGSAFRRLGRFQEAVDQCEQALRIRPNYAEAHNNLGNAFFQSGDATNAISHWVDALRINPDLAEAHNNLAVALTQQDRLPEAVEHFEQALLINPDDARTHYNLGVVLEHAGNLKEAARHWELALRIDPGFTEAHNRLARSGVAK